MQFFGADATMFQKIYLFFLLIKTRKKQAQKLLIIDPKFSKKPY